MKDHDKEKDWWEQWWAGTVYSSGMLDGSAIACFFQHQAAATSSVSLALRFSL